MNDLQRRSPTGSCPQTIGIEMILQELAQSRRYRGTSSQHERATRKSSATRSMYGSFAIFMLFESGQTATNVAD
jgi:hypothetical protein